LNENLTIKSDLDNYYLQTLFSDIPDAIIITLPDGTITHANNSFYTMFGYSFAEIKGRKISDIYSDPGIRQEVIDNFEKLAMDRLGEVETLRQRHNGSIIDVSIYGGPIFNNGEKKGVYIIYKDLTARKTAMRGLEREKIYWQKLFKNSPDGIVICDQKQVVTNSNPVFCNMFGYSLNEVIGKPLDSLITSSPEDLMEAESLTSRVIQGDRVLCQRIRYKKDGTPIHVSISGLPFMAGDKMIIYAIYRDISARKKAEFKLQEKNRQLEDSIKDTVKTMARMAEFRDPYTSGHQNRVADLSKAIALEMGHDESAAEGISIAGVIHDIGKIKIPSEILTKPGKISDIEFRLIKEHPVIGWDILKNINFPWPVAKMVLQHHERMDGSGYPLGLKKEDILMGSRILSVADVVEAMSSHRPYRAGLGIDVTLREIDEKTGILYDEDVVKACLTLFREKGFTFSD